MSYDCLTPEQQQIVDLKMRGMSDKQIAAEAGRVIQTVKNSMKRIADRYGIEGRWHQGIRLVYLRSKELGLLTVCLVIFGLTCKAQGASTCPTNMPHCAQLSWTAPTIGSAPVSYNVYQSTTNGGCATLPTQAATCIKKGTVTAPTTSYTDGPLTASTQYCYVLTSVNTMGESAGTAPICGTTNSGTAPGNPGSVVIQIF